MGRRFFLVGLVFLAMYSRATAATAQGQGAFFLGMGQMRYEQQGDDWYRPDVFYRELCRQAVLVAARDELGLLTRDAALREPPLVDSISVDLDLGNLQGKYIEYLLRRGDDKLIDGSFDYAFSSKRSAMAIIASDAEKLSRGEFRDALAGIASKSEKQVKLTAAEKSDKRQTAERRVRQFNIASQFLAIRLGHDLLADDNTSAEAMSVLARGYANLAVMSDYLLSNSRATFASRGLIYATRMVHLYPKSPSGLWHQAYVFTLFGLTKDSMWQLEIAEKLSREGEPEWLDLIRKANRFDYSGLRDSLQSKTPDSHLTAVLLFRSVECTESKALTIETGKLALTANPACLRIYDGIHQAAGVAYRHTTTITPAEVFGRTIRGGLPMLIADSALVQQCAQVDFGRYADAKTRAELAELLIQSAEQDRREPSVAVLGHLIEEINVLHVAQRIEFLTGSLAVDASDELADSRPLFGRHPIAHFIEAIGLSRYDTRSRQAAVAKGGSPELNFISGDRLLSQFSRQWATREGPLHDYRVLMKYQAPATELDYARKFSTMDDKSRLQYAGFMADINPYSALRGITLLSLNWKGEKKNLSQWLKRADEQPTIADTLASQFLKEGDLDRAEEYLRKYIKASPDCDAYLKLARLLYAKGRKKEALETAAEFLQHEDYGLSHARMNVVIARTHMHDGNYAEALPWAVAASESGAAWSYSTLSACLEALERFDDAAKVLQLDDERYGSDRLYTFAVRTSKYDLGKAWPLKLKNQQVRNGRDSIEVKLATITHHLLLGNSASAIKLLDTLEPTASKAVAIACAADQLKDASQRKSALSLLDRFQQADDQVSRSITSLLTKVMTSSQLDDDAFQDLAASEEAKDVRHTVLFAHAWCMEKVGRKDDAIKIYWQVVDYPAHHLAVSLALHRLRLLGERVFPSGGQYHGLQEQ